LRPKTKQTLGPTVAKAAEQNLDGIARMINLLSTFDDPEILATVAQMRDGMFRDALQMRLDQASARAAETAGRIITDDPLAGQRAGQAVASIVGDALSDARAQERALYGAVNLSVPASADNILIPLTKLGQTFCLNRRSRQSSRGSRTACRKIWEAEARTLRDIVNFRSEMLSMARDAAATGNYRDANFYGRMAEGALDDIGAAGRGSAGRH
jgi:hypothetical protein